MKRQVAVLAVAGLVFGGGGIALVLRDGSSAPAGPGRGPVVLRVDGVDVHRQEAVQRAASLRSMHGTDVDPSTDEWRVLVVQSLVDDVVVRQAAAELGVTVPDGAVEAEVARVRAMVGDADFDVWLAERSLTLEELRRRAELQVLWGLVRQEVTRGLKVTSGEAERHYREHLDDFTIDGTPKPFLDVRTSIEETLLAAKAQREFADWLEARRRDAEVVVVTTDWQDGAGA